MQACMHAKRSRLYLFVSCLLYLIQRYGSAMALNIIFVCGAIIIGTPVNMMEIYMNNGNNIVLDSLNVCV